VRQTILVLIACCLLLSCGEGSLSDGSPRGARAPHQDASPPHATEAMLGDVSPNDDAAYAEVAELVRRYAAEVGNQGGFGPPDLTHTSLDGACDRGSPLGRWVLRMDDLVQRLDVLRNGRFEYWSGRPELTLVGAGSWEMRAGALILNPRSSPRVVIQDASDGLSGGDVVSLMWSMH